jgi:hypothetical protein
VYPTRGKAANPDDCAPLFNNNEPGQPIDPALSIRLKLLSVLLIFSPVSKSPNHTGTGMICVKKTRSRISHAWALLSHTLNS